MNGYVLDLDKEAVKISVDVADQKIIDEKPVIDWLSRKAKRSIALYIVTRVDLLIFSLTNRSFNVYLDTNTKSSVRIAEQLLELTKELW